MKTFANSIIRSATGVILALALFLIPGKEIPGIDRQADHYFESAISQAGLAYATCRVVNASVSVVGDSQVQLEPAGIGISLAAGKVLDPIDDMTERLSNVLVTAIVSLGIQKLAYEIGASLAPDILGVILLLYAILVFIPNRHGRRFQFLLLRIGAIVLVARFLLPITSIANDFLLQEYFSDEIETTTENLAVYSSTFETLQDFEFPAYDGFFGTIENSASFVQERAIVLKEALDLMMENLGAIIDNLLTLTWLFAAIFVIQVILMPLGVLWLLVKLVNVLFAISLPVFENHKSSDTGKNESIEDKLVQPN
ncbi:hypothetical protein [Rubellicoccus peritrichatus]|uniref:Uncharacterized protein n=1 Tax=Rubellicoccus peritrichatus TaxID=3080537 RepID=A0AAQ3QTZ4_9BACT|nr:hypothetical protein [Puniceicoccus sp. CR14]WOO39933.1 hypothetical protein RZN69_15005 [Puniceicoccus sp. CR14]